MLTHCCNVFDQSSESACLINNRLTDLLQEVNGISVKPVLNLLETAEEPPTYNKINKFTAVFQAIVDSYGIASYLEVNPGENILL